MPQHLRTGTKDVTLTDHTPDRVEASQRGEGAGPSSNQAVAPSQKQPSRVGSLIENVGLTVEAFLGDAKMVVADLAALQEDSTVVLDASLSEAVTLRLNGVPIARGELVAVGDKFGVRITDISEG